jgi:hypothetical protein
MTMARKTKQITDNQITDNKTADDVVLQPITTHTVHKYFESADRELVVLNGTAKELQERRTAVKELLAEQVRESIRALSDAPDKAYFLLDVLTRFSSVIREHFTGAGLDSTARKAMERRRKLVCTTVGDIMGAKLRVVNSGSTKSPLYSLEVDPVEADPVADLIKKVGADIAGLDLLKQAFDALTLQLEEQQAAETAAWNKAVKAVPDSMIV